MRQDFKEVNGSIRWVHHLPMPADGLMKVHGSNAALFDLVETGKFCIRPTSTEMDAEQTLGMRAKAMQS